jgi:hypothetical protein
MPSVSAGAKLVQFGGVELVHLAWGLEPAEVLGRVKGKPRYARRLHRP